MLKQNPNSKHKFVWRNITIGLGACFVVIVLMLIFTPRHSPFEPIAGNSQEATQLVTDEEKVITSVVEQASPAVVSVNNYQVPRQSHQRIITGGSIFDYYTGRGQFDLSEFDQEPVLAGTGSGVVYRVDGDSAYVVTNHHVIDNADSIEITMADGQNVEAEVVGTDAISDLSVLKISSEHVTTTIEFADSDAVAVGQTAIAIGSPLSSEFASSVTKGVVSGKDREVPVHVNDEIGDMSMTLTQTDAAINPGNSGGALLNTSGQLIGINSSKYAANAVEGMGFAIPSNEVARITKQLEETGEVIRPQLGITMVDLNLISMQQRVEILGLEPEFIDGVVVLDQREESPAADSELQKFDVITKINGVETPTGQRVRQELYNYSVGDTITLTVLRNGEEMEINVLLDEAVNSSVTNSATEATPNQEGEKN